MRGFVPAYAASALNKSLISEALLDERLKMLFRVRMRLSHFDPIGPLNEIRADETICTDYAIDLSHDGARQSAALLKNKAETLPLRGDLALPELRRFVRGGVPKNVPGGTLASLPRGEARGERSGEPGALAPRLRMICEMS